MVAPKGNRGGQPEDPFTALFRMLGEVLTGEGVPNTAQNPSSRHTKTDFGNNIANWPTLDFGGDSSTVSNQPSARYQQADEMTLPARQRAAVQREQPGRKFRMPQIDSWPAANVADELSQLPLPEYGHDYIPRPGDNLQRSLGDIMREAPQARPYVNQPTPALAGPRPAGEAPALPQRNPVFEAAGDLEQKRRKMNTVRAGAGVVPIPAPLPDGPVPDQRGVTVMQAGRQPAELPGLNNAQIEQGLGEPISPEEAALTVARGGRNALSPAEREAYYPFPDSNLALGEILRQVAATNTRPAPAPVPAFSTTMEDAPAPALATPGVEATFHTPQQAYRFQDFPEASIDPARVGYTPQEQQQDAASGRYGQNTLTAQDYATPPQQLAPSPTPPPESLGQYLLEMLKGLVPGPVQPIGRKTANDRLPQEAPKTTVAKKSASPGTPDLERGKKRGKGGPSLPGAAIGATPYRRTSVHPKTMR